MPTQAELHKLYIEELRSVREIVEMTGLPQATLLRRMKACGIPLRSRAECKTKAMRDKISETKGIGKDLQHRALAMYRCGASSNEISSELGVGRTSVKRWCRNAGIIRSMSDAKFKGGRINKRGYWESTHFGDRKTPTLLHRAIAEAILARPLTRLEVVHHVNGCRSDNRPANLWVFPTDRDHHEFHNTGTIHPDTIKLIPYCGEVA